MSEIIFWACGDECEDLSYAGVDEAIEQYLSDIYPELPETIEAHGYGRQEVELRDCPDMLDNLIESLDELYGSPDDASEITDVMREAERVFYKAILAEYESWACKVAETLTINVTKWVRENRPDWINNDT